MKCGEKIWVIYDTRTGNIAESGDNSLPLIFEDEDAARDCADLVRHWDVYPAFLTREEK